MHVVWVIFFIFHKFMMFFGDTEKSSVRQRLCRIVSWSLRKKLSRKQSIEPAPRMKASRQSGQSRGEAARRICAAVAAVVTWRCACGVKKSAHSSRELCLC